MAGRHNKSRVTNKSYKVATSEMDRVFDEQVQVVMRPPRRSSPVVGGGIFNSLRRPRKHNAPSRRISCADLGAGSHSGWLYTRKPRKSSWEKCTKWCVIKDENLYIYASQRDIQATSRIHLPSFKVSEVSKKETRKIGAFKVYNQGTAFFFRCKSEDEKYEWINHLSLAAIGYDTTNLSFDAASGSTDSSGIGSSASYNTSGAWSDEEDDNSSNSEASSDLVLLRPKNSSSNSIGPPTRLKSHIDINNDMRLLATSIQAADLDLVGADAGQRRQSQLRKSMAGFTRTRSVKNNKIVFIKRAKERQKQALEHELSAINALLDYVTRSNLNEFLSRYPDYQDTMSVSSSVDSSALDSDADYEDMTDILTSITSTTTIIPSCDDVDLENNHELSDNRGHHRNTLVSSVHSDIQETEAHESNRDTLIPQCDDIIGLSTCEQIDSLTLELPNGDASSRRSSTNSPVYNQGKYNQTVTSL